MDRSKWHNPPPPNDDFFDFVKDRSIIKKKTVYYTSLGTECYYMNLFPEDAFKNITDMQPGPICISSSSEEEDEGSEEGEITSPSPVKTKDSPSPLSNLIETVKIKEEKISDEDEPIQMETVLQPPKVVTPPKVVEAHKAVELPKKVTSSKILEPHTVVQLPKVVKSKKMESPKIKSEDSKKESSKHKGEDSKKESFKHKGEDSKKYSSKSRSKWSGVEYSDSDDEREHEYRLKHEKKSRDKEPEEVKPQPHLAGALFKDYVCDVCNIVLNSKPTYDAHMRGKRHKKQIKANNISDVARQSLYGSTMKPESPNLPSVHDQPIALHSLESEPCRLPPPDPGYKRVVMAGKKSEIQKVADDYNRGPLPGLHHVVEIRHHNKEVTFYCKLCDAPCSSQSIMEHLKGYKHKLHCMKILDPESYEKYQFETKKRIENKIFEILLKDESRYGRGKIEVQEEVEDDSSSYAITSEPGPSWRSDYFDDEDEDIRDLTSKEDLDVSQNDFRCKVCDSHMNNRSMWESHVRGKRHLKNKNKVPGESASKTKAIPIPGAVPHLVKFLEDQSDPIVGLDYIRETQGESGDMYNCFLCGACTSDYDIIDHLLTTRHQTKYLEAALKKGQLNGIDSIKQLYDVSPIYKEGLITHECQNMLEQYGSGTIEVYRSKSLLPPSFGAYR